MRTDYNEVAAGLRRCKADKTSGEWRIGYPAVTAALGQPQGSKKLLDFACGAGNYTEELAAAGWQVTGVDSSQGTLEEARAANPGIEYLHYQGLLGSLLKMKGFEVICVTYGFCAIPDTELRYILRDMRLLLKTGGRLVILDPNHEKAHGVEYRTLHHHAKENPQVGDHVSVTLKRPSGNLLLEGDIYRTQAHWKWLLESTGFTVGSMLEPLPDPSWGPEWDLERAHPPCLVIMAT